MWHLDVYVHQVTAFQTTLFNFSDLARAGWIEFGQIRDFEQYRFDYIAVGDPANVEPQRDSNADIAELLQGCRRTCSRS